MKKRILLLLALATVFHSRGQTQDGMNQNLMLVPTKESNKMKSLEGSPYLQEDFEHGTATVEGKRPLKLFMRYNAHQDEIEIKTNLQSEDIYLLPKKETTVYVIGADTFVLDQVVHNGNRISGYFLEHYKGENFRVLEKPVVTVTEPVKAKTGYDRDRPAKIKIEEEFYVVDKDGQVHNVRLKHRDIKKAFDSDRAKKYLSNNKIRSEQDLISFISYLDKD